MLHPEWHPIVQKSLAVMDAAYLEKIKNSEDWLPGSQAVFAALSRPLSTTRYILLGESPYPRAASANGYAFWDAAVGSLWSDTGFSKEVNRATSLRNFLKMLLVTEGLLNSDLSQAAIQKLDKASFVKTAADFFQGMMARGFILLNACLVYRANEVKYHAQQWRSFMSEFFRQLKEIKPDIDFILFGAVARQIEETQFFSGITAEHPYNLSFIHNEKVQAFFKPLNLLRPYYDINH